MSTKPEQGKDDKPLHTNKGKDDKPLHTNKGKDDQPIQPSGQYQAMVDEGRKLRERVASLETRLHEINCSLHMVNLYFKLVLQ